MTFQLFGIRWTGNMCPPLEHPGALVFRVTCYRQRGDQLRRSCSKFRFRTNKLWGSSDERLRTVRVAHGKRTLMTVVAVLSVIPGQGLPFEYTNIGCEVPGLGKSVLLVVPMLKSPLLCVTTAPTCSCSPTFHSSCITSRHTLRL